MRNTVYHKKRGRRRIGFRGVMVALFSVAVVWGVCRISFPPEAKTPPEELPREETVNVEGLTQESVKAEELTPIEERKETPKAAPEVLHAEAGLTELAVQTQMVPQSEPVDDGYFADAIFVGDSRTDGFRLYGGLNQGTYLCGTGATVDSVFNRTTVSVGGRTLPVMEALKTMNPGKVYLMLGVNELGWVREELFQERYSDIVDQIRSNHPDAKIVLQSILPVTRTQEEKHTYVNNERIAEYNEMVRQVAEEKQCWFLDVKEAVTDEAGFLREDLSSDGVHLTREGYQIWHAYLNSHAV